MSAVFEADVIEALSAPLDSRHVKERTQAGRKLSYIEGWWAISEANRIFGYDSWNRETIEIKCVAEKPREIGAAKKDGWGVSYIAKVRVTVGRTLVREGIGSGHGIDVDLGLAHESAIKEAETDAMKRALMTFGNPFGLALYDKTQENVTDTISLAAKKYMELAIPIIERTKSAGALKEWWDLEKQIRDDLLDDLQYERLKQVLDAKVKDLSTKGVENAKI